jgi:hypothetical protein
MIVVHLTVSESHSGATQKKNQGVEASGGHGKLDGRIPAGAAAAKYEIGAEKSHEEHQFDEHE